MRRRRRRTEHDWAWHEARMNEGPQGLIRESGVKSWDGLHELAIETTNRWLSMSRRDQLFYAFPLPEDRA